MFLFASFFFHAASAKFYCSSAELTYLTQPWEEFRSDWLSVPTYNDGSVNQVFLLEGIRKDICTGFRLMTHHDDFFLKSALFSNTTYSPNDSSFIEIENKSCDAPGECPVRLCCPPISENGIASYGEFKCEDRALFENAENGPFYTTYWDGYDYVENRRNVLLDDANFRFDICQAFAASKFDDSFQLNSFIFAQSSFLQSDVRKYEINGDQIRFCCPGSKHPETQLDDIIDHYVAQVDKSATLKNKKKFKKRLHQVLGKRKNQMKKEYMKKEVDCVYADSTELKVSTAEALNILTSETFEKLRIWAERYTARCDESESKYMKKLVRSLANFEEKILSKI